MQKTEQGVISTWLIVAIVSTVLFLCAASFGVWAFLERGDYKNNSDQKAAVAVKAAEKVQAAKLEAEFVEREKSPLREYVGRDIYGTIRFQYPKTWSGYVEEAGSSKLVDAYFATGIVKGAKNPNDTAFALRFEVLDSPFEREITKFDTLIKGGKVTSTAYMPVKMEKANVKPGVRFVGEVSSGKQGVMVVLKVRDKTLRIWTESKDTTNDFDQTILKSLSYVP